MSYLIDEERSVIKSAWGGLDEEGFYVLCFMFYVYDGRERGVQMRLSPGLRGERWNTFSGPKKRESRERGRDPDWIGLDSLAGGKFCFRRGWGFDLERRGGGGGEKVEFARCSL